MKKLICVIIVVLSLAILSASFSLAEIKAGTDLALKKSTFGTYSNLPAATDGVISMKKIAPAASGAVADADQFLTVDLGTLAYVDRVRIHFDAAAYPKAFGVRTSTDGKYWETEAVNLNAASGAKDAATNTVALSVSCKRAVIGARFVQIEIPAGAAVSSGARVRVAEIEVFPAMGQKLGMGGSSVIATEKSAVVNFKTTIGAVSGRVLYGTSPNDLSAVAPNQESGIDNSATLYGLKPGTLYYYRAEAKDLYGNAVASDVLNFSTLNTNVASKKSVEGTFTELPPRDPFIEKTASVLSRVNDNSTNYFTSMATSKSVFDADQYVVIDLGGVYSIKDIQAYWRKLAYPENYSVLVSQDNASWTAVAEGLNAGDGAFSRSDTGDPMQVNSVATANTQARFVKILVKQGSPFFHKHADWNFVQLMEVKVFAD